MYFMCKEIKLTTGERLKDLRKAAGLTCEQLCAEIGEKYGFTITKSKYCEIENDVDKDFGFRSFICFAKYFNVSTDYLLGLSEDKTADKDEQTAIAVTGLNEKAINYLKRLTQGQKAALTFMLERINFIDILELFQQAKIMQNYLPHNNQAILESAAAATADIDILEPLTRKESNVHHIYKEAIQGLMSYSPQLRDIGVIISFTGLEPVFKHTISEYMIKIFDEYKNELESK